MVKEGWIFGLSTVPPKASSVPPIPPKAAEKAVTKAVETVVVDPVVTPKSPKEPPKSKPKLSGAFLDLTGDDSSVGLSRVAGPVGAIGSRRREIRLSLDFNNTSTVRSPGERQLDGVSTECATAILDYLKTSPSHRLRITSYIGAGGNQSIPGRRGLLKNVLFLNRRLQTEGIGSDQLVALHITKDRTKSVLTTKRVSGHLDDKIDTCESLIYQDREFQAVLFTNRYHRSLETADSVPGFFNQLLARIVPKVYELPFFEVPPIWTNVDR